MLCINLFFKLIVIHLCIIIYTYNLINKIKNQQQSGISSLSSDVKIYQ